MVACSASRAFLQTPDQLWTAWLDEVVDVDVQNVPFADLSRRGPFREKAIVFSGVDGDAVVSLEAAHVPRRQAFRLLAEKYGLSISFVCEGGGHPTAILITNREILRANRPLN